MPPSGATTGSPPVASGSASTTWVIGEVVIIELTGSAALRRVDPLTGFELLEIEG